MRPLVGLTLWDTGGDELFGVGRGPDVQDYYDRRLAAELVAYRGLLDVAELAQDADYQSKDIRTWHRQDLRTVPGVIHMLLTTRRLGLHLRHRNVDLADHETPTHRRWSVAEDRAGLEFAMRLGADACILHPGTFNERSGRFWPRAEELDELLRGRRAALEESLAELAGAWVALAVEQEARLRGFEESHREVKDELTSLLRALRREDGAEERVRLLGRGIDLVTRHDLTPEQIRHCMVPWSGCHICLENLEPPNFLVCTPAQMGSLLARFSEFFMEAAAHGGLAPETVERYRPRLALDPGHLLNAKVILTQPVNAPFLEPLPGAEDMQRDFVHLPGEYPPGADGAPVEPLLNLFMRRYGGELGWVHLNGCQRTDTCMTTHGPVKPFRGSELKARAASGQVVTLYGTGMYRPLEELNLEEVVQVLGSSLPYVIEVFGHPIESVKSSVVHTAHYLAYVDDERSRAASAVRAALARHAEDPSLDDASRARLGWIASALIDARAYMRPVRSAAGFWTVGYDELGFYRFVDDPETGNVDIFATVKQADGLVWLKGISPA